jgi:hypothetical protein
MPLFLLPLKFEDFDTLTSHADIHPPDVNLVSPLYSISWPVQTTHEAQERTRFVMNCERQRFLEDTSAHYLKVVSAASLAASTDPEQADIISLAHWHFYSDGFNLETILEWEKCTLPAGQEVWPRGFNRTLHDNFLLTRNKDREQKIGKGTPCWILMGLITRADQRRRGAARMIMQWGIEKSENSGALAYLDTGVQSKAIYERFVFEMVGETCEIDLRRWGGLTEISIANMVRWPKRLERKHEEVGEA